MGCQAQGNTPAEAPREVARLDLQPLAHLVDADLPCRRLLEERLEPRIDAFAQALPHTPSCWFYGSYRWLLSDLGTDNFGLWGSRRLLTRLGFGLPTPQFLSRAWPRIVSHIDEQRAKEAVADVGVEALEATHGGAGEGGVDGVQPLRPHPSGKRIMYCFAEFDFRAPEGAEPADTQGLHGALVFESGFHGDDAVRASSWLVAEDLPHSQRVDRVHCCEFQALTALCQRLEEGVAAEAEIEAGNQEEAAAWRAQVGGAVLLLTTGVSCLSCIGAMRQFQQLFPGVSVDIAMQDWWPHAHGAWPGLLAMA
mmetsp:Transcript_7356/g.22483  ORF Transcript_7356/g.22483 Transcript_7356/m.22483 type:complete len:309 (+) Transcript_7356:276-1202(+)